MGHNKSLRELIPAGIFAIIQEMMARNPIIKIILILAVGAAFLIPALFSNASLIDDLKKQIADRERELQGLEKKSTEYKSNIKESQKQQKTLKGTIQELNGQIGYLEGQEQITKTKLDQTSLFIEKLKLEIKEQEDDLRLKKIFVASAIQTIDEFDNISLMELLLTNRNLSNFLNQTEYVTELEEKIQKNIYSLQLLKSKLEERKEEQEEKEDELTELKNDLSSKRTLTNSQKNKKEKLLKDTKNQEKTYAILLKEVQKKHEAIQKEIYELEEKLKYTIDPSTIPAARPGLLDWPAKGRLTQKWGPTSETGFINDAYKFHNGLDIAAPIGTPIYAPLNGKVAAIGDNGQYAYGKWIAIDHGNGLVTLYAHLSIQSVSSGSEVKKGQKIGYMGSTGFSTGSHLHFTVYAANTFNVTKRWFGLLPLGASINPMDYLTQ